MCDDATVGTFTNLGFEDDRTGESCFLEEKAGASLGTTEAWKGPYDLLCPGQIHTFC